MSLASALNILRPTLPCYLALTKYGLLRLDAHTFQLHPHPSAPLLALEMAKAVFTMRASSCIESYTMSRMLSEGPKVFAFDALTCEALEKARTLLPLLLFVPAWALLGGFSALDSGHPGRFGMLVGGVISVVCGLGFGRYKGKIMDTLFGPEEGRDDKWASQSMISRLLLDR